MSAIGRLQRTQRDEYELQQEQREDDGCCALDPGHEGVCAYICSECNGNTYCWACGGPSGDDLGTGCALCDGTGYCFGCYEGMVTDD